MSKRKKYTRNEYIDDLVSTMKPISRREMLHFINKDEGILKIIDKQVLKSNSIQDCIVNYESLGKITNKRRAELKSQLDELDKDFAEIRIRIIQAHIEYLCKLMDRLKKIPVTK